MRCWRGHSRLAHRCVLGAVEAGFGAADGATRRLLEGYLAVGEGSSGLPGGMKAAVLSRI